MKKLMIVAAVVCAAAFAHAGAYTWGFGSGADITPGGSAEMEEFLEGGTAMLFLGSIGETLNANGTYALDFSKATLVGDPAGQNVDDESYTFGKLAYDSSYTSALVSEAGSQAYSLILFSDSDVTDFANYEGNYFIATGSSIAQQDQGTGDLYADFSYGDAVGGSDWKVAGPATIPEPTSGLLLLLGVAGLALRRRRA